MKHIFRFPVRLIIQNTYEGKLIGFEFIKPCIEKKKPLWMVEDLSGLLKPMDDDLY